MKNKLSIVDYIDKNKFSSVAEIGTGTAKFSKYILDHSSIKKLYCIDPWEKWEFRKGSGGKHYKCGDGESRFIIANSILKDYGDRVDIIRNFSYDALSKIPDGSLDACCIDGDLTFDGLLNDLRMYFPKVKEGGVIWGHSYADNTDTKMVFHHAKLMPIQSSTKRVIDTFARRYGQELKITTSSKDHSWYFFKKKYTPPQKLSIDVCIHCYNYQRRLCWMLSSILQQKGDIPDITVRISHAFLNGNPNTEKVCDFFRQRGLKIIETVLDEKQSSNRAIARNIQIKETNSDWVLFADSDMVYDQYFFSDLQSKLNSKYKYETKCIGADRYSLDIPFCIQYFEKDHRAYPCVIENVSDITRQWPVKSAFGKMTAAGYFQVANVDAIRARSGFYSSKENDLWRGTKSDIRFRVMMGGRVPIETTGQWHLNHDRQGPELQR